MAAETFFTADRRKHAQTVLFSSANLADKQKKGTSRPTGTLLALN